MLLTPSRGARRARTMTRPTMVTGASGFVGSHVCSVLADRGVPFVGVLSPRSQGPLPWREWPPEAFLRADLRDAPALARLIADLEPRCIINLAASGVAPGSVDDMAEFVDVNLRLPALLFDAMPRDATLVHVGSMYEFANPGDPIREEDPKGDHHTLYGLTKAAADDFLRIATRRSPVDGRRCVRARLFLACGAGERKHRLIPSIVRAWRTQRPLDLSDGTQERDLLHAHDAACGILHVASVPELDGLSVNVARGEAHPIRWIAERAADRLGCRELLRFGALPRRHGEPERTVADVERIRRAGWSPTLDIDATIARAVDDMLAAPEETDDESG